MKINIDKALLLSLLAGYTGKVAVLGASPADAAIILVLAAGHFLYNSQIQNKEIQTLKAEIKDLRDVDDKLINDLAEIKAMTSAMKMASGLRPAK